MSSTAERHRAWRGPARAVRQWLPDYDTAWLRPDLVAGLTLAAYLLPAGIGDASLAGLPPEAGLYACLFSGLVFWLFCSSQADRHHGNVRVVAAHRRVGRRIQRWRSRAACRAGGVRSRCMVAAIAVVAWLVRAGNAVGFFSETVLVGFKSRTRVLPGEHAAAEAVRLQGHRTAISGSARRISSRHLGETHGMSLMVGVGALAFLIARQAMAEEPAGRVLRGARRHPRGAGLGPRGARRRVAGRRAPGAAVAGAAASSAAHDAE